jgi:hypothetical protein
MTPEAGMVPVLGLSGFTRVAMLDWGPPQAGGPTVICLHRLTRNARDFDALAAALAAAGHRRGRSCSSRRCAGAGACARSPDARAYGWGRRRRGVAIGARTPQRG